MKANITIYLLCSALALIFVTVGQVMAANYPASIIYKQTMVKVLQETDVQGWPSGLTTTPRYPENITVSANGAKVGFTVKLNYYSDRHIYVMNGDGSNLVDLTSNLPSGVGVGTLQMNDDGSRLFFWDYAKGNIYYFNTASPYTIQPAYKPDAFWLGSKRSYSLNSTGTILYLKHFWNVETISHYGLVSTVVGSNVLTPVVDVLSLTPAKTADYDLQFLDAARSGDKLLLTYYPDYWHDSRKVMWKTNPLQPMPSDWHNMIWDNSATNLQFCHIISSDGSKALYNFQNTGSRPELHLLNLNTGGKSLLVQLVDGYDFLQFPTLSPDGTIARWGSNGYNGTRRVIATGDLRDTFSYRFPESRSVGASNLTDITSDNRYYYMGSEPASVSYIHRIDMAPVSTAPAPDIVSISFGKPQLVLHDTTSVPIAVQVSDPKGVNNIQSVEMYTLIHGREFPYGLVHLPLNFQNPLTDSGGGVFTGTISPNTNSNFYTTAELPQPVGVRVVVRSKDEHYVMADTEINVFSTEPEPPIEKLNITNANLNTTGRVSANSPVSYTVNATDQNGHDLYYKFFYCAHYGTPAYNTSPWVVMQNYSTRNTCEYTFPEEGSYIVVARVVSDPDNEPEDLPIIGGVVSVGGNANIQLTSLSSSTTGTVSAGTPVSYTVQVSNSSVGAIYYKWFYCANYGTPNYGSSPWVVVQNYSTNNTCNYTFPNTGKYIIVVRAVTDPTHEPDDLPIIGCVVDVQ